MEVLESVFGDAFLVIKESRHWKISLPIDVLQPHSLTVHVYIPKISHYPYSLPVFYFHHPKLKPTQNMRLIQNGLRHLSSATGDAMTYELLEWVKESVST